MNRMKKVIKSLEKSYNCDINVILKSYKELKSINQIAEENEKTPYCIATILKHLQLKRPKTKRIESYANFEAQLKAQDNDEALELFENLESENLHLTKSVESLQKSLIKTRHQLNILRKTQRNTVKQELSVESVVGALQECLTLNTKVDKSTYFTASEASLAYAKYTSVLVLSDLHVEEVVDSKDVGALNEYNWEIMERRLGNVISALVNTYKGQDRLVVCILGDVISGIIHDQLENSSVPVAEACVKLAQLLSQYIVSLSNIYNVVEIKCVNGNHGRLDNKIKSTSKGFDFEYLVYSMLDAYTKDTENVQVDVSTTGFNYFKVGEAKIVALHHGDYFRQPVGTEARDFKIYEAFSDSTGKVATDIIQGHTHNFQVYNTSRGTVIVNGSLIGSSAYGHTNGFTKIPPSQTVIEYTPDGKIDYVKQVVANEYE